MKHLLVLLVISLVFLAACTKEKEENCVIKLNKPFTIEYNQSACSETEQFVVKFDSVVTDCRCPSDAVCIWAGYAKIKLVLTQNKKTTPFYLSTLNSQTDNVVSGYRFHVNSIEPYPATTNYPSSDQYKAQIVITK